MDIKQAYLQFVAGSSSKFYRLTLSQDGSGTYTVRADWGRIGTAGQTGNKVAGVSLAAAENAFASTLGEKTGKGYQYAPDPRGGSATVSPAVAAARATAAPAVAGAQRMPYITAQLAGARGDLRAALANPGRFAIEEKFDGFRGLLRLLDGTVTLLNRDGVDKGAKTGNAPTLVAAATAWANADKARWNGTLLDGEVFGGSWSNTAHLLGGAGRTTAGLRYIVFDVPYLAGRDLRSLSWTERRAILVKELASAPAPFEVSVILPPTASVVDDIWARGGEGVIIKDRTADYRSGDRTTWTKIKEEIEFDAVITGFDPGVGKYSQTTGAVRVSQFRGGVLTHVTSVSGMTDDVRHSLNESVIGRVVECRAQAKTADSYRHPRWFRLRPDKKPADCRWEDS